MHSNSAVLMGGVEEMNKADQARLQQGFRELTLGIKHHKVKDIGWGHWEKT